MNPRPQSFLEKLPSDQRALYLGSFVTGFQSQMSDADNGDRGGLEAFTRAFPAAMVAVD